MLVSGNFQIISGKLIIICIPYQRLFFLSIDTHICAGGRKGEGSCEVSQIFFICSFHVQIFSAGRQWGSFNNKDR